VYENCCDAGEIMPEYWLHTRGCEAQGSAPTWNFARFIPDLLVINLGTNDFVILPYFHNRFHA
jgi:hypothetical protein